MVVGRSSLSVLAPAFGLALLAACSKSTSAPSSQSLTDFATGVQSSDGTSNGVLSSHGSPPAATSGGPAGTVYAAGTTSSATVINGGSSLVHLHSASSFNTVFMSVIDDPLDGFFTLTLPAATTDTFVVVQLGRTIPVNTFQTVFSVSSPAGQVGTSASIANTVNTQAVTGQVQVSLNWDALADVDLHVIEPSGHEIYWADRGPSSTGGTLDLDSNAGCSIDGKNNENIRWTTAAPNGTYTVKVDLWDGCGTNSVNTVVTVNNGGQSLVFNKSFTSGQADHGSAGAGTLITTFVHSGSSLTTQDAPVAPQPLTPDVLRKLAISHATIH